MPLDQQVRELLDERAAEQSPPLGSTDPVAARLEFRELALARNGGDLSVPAGVTTADRRVEDIAVRVYTPAGADGPLPVTVHAHGGGWVAGDLDTHAGQAGAICADAQTIVVSVDYRLAPEHPFPAAVEDVLAVLSWVSTNAEDLGGDSARIGVAGDSAGGNIVAAVALEPSAPPLSCQLLIYPATDPTMTAPSIAENATGMLLEAEAMRQSWDQYLPDAALAKDPRAALHTSDRLSHAPPALIVTAEFDPLRDEAEEYAELLRAAGVETQLRRFDGLIHGFFGMGARVDAARKAVTWTCARWGELLRS